MGLRLRWLRDWLVSVGLWWGPGSDFPRRVSAAGTGRFSYPSAHPFPSGRGRNGSSEPLRPPQLLTWGRGEEFGGTLTSSAWWVWKGEAGQEVRASWAFSRPSAGRVELRAWQPSRFSFLPASCALIFVLLLKSVASPRRELSPL